MDPKIARAESPEDITEEVDTLVEWAECEEEKADEIYHQHAGEEPCEADILEDCVGLPRGTQADLNKMAESVDE